MQQSAALSARVMELRPGRPRPREIFLFPICRAEREEDR